MNDEKNDTPRSVRPEYEDTAGAQDASDAQGSSGALIWLGGLLVLVLVAAAGFGSSVGWFDSLASEAESSTESGSIATAINAQLDQASAGGAEEQSTLDLPALIPGHAKTQEEALAECRVITDHLVAVTKSSLDALEMQARFEKTFGEPEKAREIWQNILERNENYTYAVRGLGDLAVEDGELEKAVEYYRRAAIAQPQDVERQVTLATTLFDANELDEAERIFDAVVKVHPDHFIAQLKLGQVNLQQRDFEGARVAFEAAEAIFTENAELHYGLATALARLGERELAQEHLKEQKRLRQKRQEELREERKQYDDVSAFMIDASELLTDLARVYLNSGFPIAAELILHRAGRMNPRDKQPKQALAWIAVNKGRFYDGIRWLSQIYEAEPADFTILGEISRLYVEVGQADKAEELLLEFIEREPENPAALLNISQFYYDAKDDMAKAITYAESLAKIHEQSSAFEWLCTLHQVNGDLDNAIVAMEKASELSPENTEYTRVLGLLRLRASTQTDSQNTNE